jgi:hypothetical protein
MTQVKPIEPIMTQVKPIEPIMTQVDLHDDYISTQKKHKLVDDSNPKTITIKLDNPSVDSTLSQVKTESNPKTITINLNSNSVEPNKDDQNLSLSDKIGIKTELREIKELLGKHLQSSPNIKKKERNIKDDITINGIKYNLEDSDTSPIVSLEKNNYINIGPHMTPIDKISNPSNIKEPIDKISNPPNNIFNPIEKVLIPSDRIFNPIDHKLSHTDIKIPVITKTVSDANLPVDISVINTKDNYCSIQ